MTQIRTNLTAEDLSRMPRDGVRRELVQGEIVEMTPAGYEHGRICSAFHRHLSNHVADHDLGQTLIAETGYILERSPDTVRAPDVSFVSNSRIPPNDEQQAFAALAPDAVAEIISPNDRSDQIEKKINEYLDAGVRLIWVVYPATKTITEYCSRDNVRILTSSDTLDGFDVVPGFALLVAKIFE